MGRAGVSFTDRLARFRSRRQNVIENAQPRDELKEQSTVRSHQVTYPSKNLFGLLRPGLIAKTSLRDNAGGQLKMKRQIPNLNMVRSAWRRVKKDIKDAIIRDLKPVKDVKGGCYGRIQTHHRRGRQRDQTWPLIRVKSCHWSVGEIIIHISERASNCSKVTLGWFKSMCDPYRTLGRSVSARVRMPALSLLLETIPGIDTSGSV